MKVNVDVQQLLPLMKSFYEFSGIYARRNCKVYSKAQGRDGKEKHLTSASVLKRQEGKKKNK